MLGVVVPNPHHLLDPPLALRRPRLVDDGLGAVDDARPLPVPLSATALRKRPQTDVRSAWSSASLENRPERIRVHIPPDLGDRFHGRSFHGNPAAAGHDGYPIVALPSRADATRFTRGAVHYYAFIVQSPKCRQKITLKEKLFSHTFVR